MRRSIGFISVFLLLLMIGSATAQTDPTPTPPLDTFM